MPVSESISPSISYLAKGMMRMNHGMISTFLMGLVATGFSSVAPSASQIPSQTPSPATASVFINRKPLQPGAFYPLPLTSVRP